MTWKMAVIFFSFVVFIVAYAVEGLALLFQMAIDNLKDPVRILVGTVDPPAYLFFFPIILAIFVVVWILLSLSRRIGYASGVAFPPAEPASVDVVLTAYNDEQSIGPTVRDFRSHPLVRSVIVVDNNSIDGTSEAAFREGAIVHRELWQGYGFACISGLKYALTKCDGRAVVLCEGDGTFRASDLDKMVPYLCNVDMVIGTRTTTQLAFRDSQMDWFYFWGNKLMAKLIEAKFFDVKNFGRVRLSDVGCTFRVIRRDALARMVDSLEVGGHHFSPHMIMVAISKGISMIEIPITFSKRIGKSKGAGGSHSLGFRVGLQMIWHIVWS